MPIPEIKKLRHYETRLNIVLSELETLEDGKDFDYEEIITDLGYLTRGLEMRRERLLKKGKTL